MNFIFKILLIISSSISIYSCGGGGGGGGSGGGMSASTPIAINFTETLSVTRGLVATYKDNGVGNNPDTHAEEIGYTSEHIFGGFNWHQDADTDEFSVRIRYAVF